MKFSPFFSKKMIKSIILTFICEYILQATRLQKWDNGDSIQSLMSLGGLRDDSHSASASEVLRSLTSAIQSAKTRFSGLL